MKVYCPTLLPGRFFPARCTHKDMPGGVNASPLIAWTDVPSTTRSFVLAMVDRNSAVENFVHWLLINIPASTREIPEKSSGIRERMPRGTMELRNGFGDNGYGGPYLLPGAGLHEYVVTVYAVKDELVELGPLASLADVIQEINDKILGSSSTSGYLRT